jgi:hypothetical protein
VNEYSPFPPLLHRPRTRHDISIAELVDEENSSSDTRGGVNHISRTAVTRANVSTAHTYPQLSICTVVALVVLPNRPQNPSTPPVVNPLSRPTCGARKTPRRSKRKAVSLTASEDSGQPATRSGIKRKATKDSETEIGSSKRAKSVRS